MLERTNRDIPDFQPLDWRRCKPSEILARVHAAGIVGLGGAGYPASAKLESGLQYGTRHVIANGVECEPTVNADLTLMQHHVDDVLEGLRIVGHCLSCDALTLAVANQALFDKLTQDLESDISYRLVSNSPANGEERMLIKQLLDEDVPRDRYPSHRGIVVFNVATLFAICEAVRDGYRLNDRVVTVFDEERWLDSGTSIQQLSALNENMRIGSEATGYSASRNETIQITTNAIAYDHASEARGCIRCNWCDEACPRSLAVQAMNDAIVQHDVSSKLTNHFEACFECGACVVVCPSQIPLLDAIRLGKQQILDERIKEHADIRFQRHTERETLRQSEEESARTTRLHTPREW